MSSASETTASERTPKDFIRETVEADLAGGKHREVVVRFPPEPNGYLHIGHAKSICLNFGIAQDYGGRCHLRFDDTNPAKEETEYVDAIQTDVKWLGFDWNDHLYFASDYFGKLYDFAVELISKGLAYVDSQTPEEMRANRGTLTEPGHNSPYRDRSVAENLDLFRRMRDGEFADGAHVLRAKIDMASPNLNMRDPALYRIKRTHHHRTGDAWCLYPMYDYTHPISDALEGITHSICTLEFEDHRPLYDWVLDHISIDTHPQQIEFARLNITHTVMSKRKLLELVTTQRVSGWDDPRMPTIAGLRRRGYTPRGIRNFCSAIGVTKANGVVEYGLLEHFVREDLNQTARRTMVVLKPLKVVIENYPEGQVEYLEGENNPEDASAGSRQLPFSRELYVEQDDFREEAPKKWFRLSPGKEVRLKHAYYITCREVIKDATGEVVELRCTYDPQSRGGTPDNRVVKGTLHWVSAAHAVPVEVRNYEALFAVASPSGDLDNELNPNSLEVLQGCLAEPALAGAQPGERYQFLRMGYYCVDRDSAPGKLVFNRTATLKDAWARMEKREGQPG
ncbi:MAG: glutamine--tRNA ligase/YqeY domain fusion protein [Candidatus Sericytochromatia bacterium]|nr:glutamine--tRNA ligase/YqeY domain fusion protein [Candidatus Sericytochromatia bacterium]